MSKISLLKEEVKVLSFINKLQNKVNEVIYIDDTFDELMEKHFFNMTSNISEVEKVRLRIILLNLEELNLIEGDVLNSPRITEEGKDLLNYHLEREKILYSLIGGAVLFYGIAIVHKIFKK